MKESKKKPTKCWQFGLDFLLNENGDVHFIEANNGAVVVLPTTHKKKGIHYDENIEGMNNVEYSARLYSKYLIKYLNQIGVKLITFKTLWDWGYNIKGIISEELRKEGIFITIDGFKIFCEEDLITKQNNDSWSKDKNIIKNHINEFIKDGITPIGKMSNYKEGSRFPNFLLKPISGGQGDGIIFYNQENIVEKNGFITEEYMVAKTVTESYNFINNKIVKKTHAPRLCDYRSKIIIDDVGNVAYVGTHRRTSSVDIPEVLSYGLIGEDHPNYDTYLCNATKNAYRTLLLNDEQDFWEDLSVKVGKTLYELFLKNE